MSMTFRHYNINEDFGLISDFLVAQFQPGNRDGNWLQPTWEYMHSHPALDESALDKIGIWGKDGEIVGVAHYELSLGEAFFEIAPGYDALKVPMLDYAEANLYSEIEDRQRLVRAYVNDFDVGFEAVVRLRGYEQDPGWTRPMSRFTIRTPFPEITVPNGFQIKSLADENDLRKVQRVLWRGFNHEGEPPEEELDGQRKMQSVPNFNKELKIVVQAPDGNFVSFCGMWYDDVNKLAYVEPVATDPDYRRMGLGKAAVLEGIRRCGDLGAEVAFVGSDQPFYLAIGFETLFRANCWLKQV